MHVGGFLRAGSKCHMLLVLEQGILLEMVYFNKSTKNIYSVFRQ
jgi:hypothetical protein